MSFELFMLCLGWSSVGVLSVKLFQAEREIKALRHLLDIVGKATERAGFSRFGNEGE